MSSKPISVIIPTYQRRDSVKRVLHALKSQTMPPASFEVLVVIDGSEDGTQELIANTEYPYHLRSIFQSNQGRAAACNRGIYNAEGDLIVLLDDDMEPAPGFLAAHWRAHQGRDRLGILGAVPVQIRPELSHVNIFIAEKFRRHLEKLAQPGYQLNLRDFYSGNFSIRRDLILEGGLFDEEFTLYGNEDLELSLRLRKIGVTLVYCSDALAYQHYEKDFPALAQDNLAKGKTALLFVKKHPEVYSELSLSTYAEVSTKWRILRAALLQLSRVWSTTPHYVIRLITLLERIRPARLERYYHLALDYFYWLGVKNGD